MSPFTAHHIKAFHLRLTAEGKLEAYAINEPAHGEGIPPHLCVAIGSFDGVHEGHHSVIAAATETAHVRGHKSAVISFDPHPQRYFQTLKGIEAEPFRLMHVPQQLRAYEALGADYALICDFDANLSALSAEDFARVILSEQLRASHVSAGFDFSFGKRGPNQPAGKAEDLVAFGAKFGFTTTILDRQDDADGNKLSSSAVREALQAGDFGRATAILGHPQAYMGPVIKGDQIGRTLGFPTLNVDLGDYVRPKYGVFVTRTRFEDGTVLGSVTNLGRRPTIAEGLSERFETFVFDLHHEVYGQTIEVELLHYLRPDMKFSSLDELKAQIATDTDQAKSWLNAHAHT